MCSIAPNLSHRLARRTQAAAPPTIPPTLDAVALPSPTPDPKRRLAVALEARGFDPASADFLARTFDRHNTLSEDEVEQRADHITSDAGALADEALKDADALAFDLNDLEALTFEPAPAPKCPCSICNAFDLNGVDPYKYGGAA